VEWIKDVVQLKARSMYGDREEAPLLVPRIFFVNSLWLSFSFPVSIFWTYYDINEDSIFPINSSVGIFYQNLKRCNFLIKYTIWMGFMLWTWIVIPRYVLCLLFLSIAKTIMR
jgi:hypothetical protein